MLTRAHDGFLALIAPSLKWHGERSPEIPAVASQADLVWEVEQHNGKRGLLHIELQLQVEDDIGERLAEYAIRIWRRDHLPVRSVVVFLRKARATPTSPFVIAWEQQESLRYTFDVVRLWEIGAGAGDIGVHPLAPDESHGWCDCRHDGAGSRADRDLASTPAGA